MGKDVPTSNTEKPNNPIYKCLILWQMILISTENDFLNTAVSWNR